MTPHFRTCITDKNQDKPVQFFSVTLDHARDEAKMRLKGCTPTGVAKIYETKETMIEVILQPEVVKVDAGTAVSRPKDSQA